MGLKVNGSRLADVRKIKERTSFYMGKSIRLPLKTSFYVTVSCSTYSSSTKIAVQHQAPYVRRNYEPPAENFLKSATRK